MADRTTMTGLAPAGLYADIQANGFEAPFSADPQAKGLITDRDGNGFHVIATHTGRGPDLRAKLAVFYAAALTQLAAEAKRVCDPLDPQHTEAVRAESRRFASQAGGCRDSELVAESQTARRAPSTAAE